MQSASQTPVGAILRIIGMAIKYCYVNGPTNLWRRGTSQFPHLRLGVRCGEMLGMARHSHTNRLSLLAHLTVDPYTPILVHVISGRL